MYMYTHTYSITGLYLELIEIISNILKFETNLIKPPFSCSKMMEVKPI